MKKLLLLLILIPLHSLSQEQVQQSTTKINVVTKNVELAEKKPSELKVIKGELPDLEKVVGFAVADARCGDCDFDPLNETGARLKKRIRKSLSTTPFEFDNKWKPKKGYKNGWLYISIIQSEPDNNNVGHTWLFKNETRRTIFSVQSVNKQVSQVLAELGITTF